MKIRVASKKAEPQRGQRAGSIEFYLVWPDGVFRFFERSRPKATIGYLERRFAELEPELRADARVRAFTKVWGAAGGHRRLLLAEWSYAGREPLGVFLARARAKADEIPWPASATLGDAWIDEADLPPRAGVQIPERGER